VAGHFPCERRAQVKLAATLRPFDAFLAARHISEFRRRLFAGIVVRHLFPAIGRHVTDVESLRDGFPAWPDALGDELNVGERGALRGFAQYLQRARRPRVLADAIERYLLGLARRGRAYGTLKTHRRAVTKLARHFGAESRLDAIPIDALRAAFTELIARDNKDFICGAHHFADFLTAKQLADAPLDLFRASSPRQQRLKQLIEVAERSSGFDAALGRYLRELRDERQLSLSHILSVQHRLLRFKDFVVEHGRCAPEDVGGDDIARYRDEAVDRGVTQFHKVLSDIRCFYRFLMRRGDVTHDPTHGVHAKVRARCPRKPLDLDDLRALLAAPLRDLDHEPLAAGDPATRKRGRLFAIRDHAILAVLIETGLRPAELVALTVDDLDLARGILHVRGKGSHDTAARERLAYLESDVTLAALRDYLALRPVAPHKQLFLSLTAMPLRAAMLCNIVGRRGKQAGLDRSVCPYDLRVSFASRLVVGGADPFALRTLMGHDNITTTFRLYANLSLDEVRAVWRDTNPLAPPPTTRGGAA